MFTGRTFYVCVFATIITLVLANAHVLAGPLSDFDDGTLQGWQPATTAAFTIPFGGLLDLQLAGGNPGGFMMATDTSGGGLWVQAPPAFNGNLNLYTDLQWDEYIFPNSGITKPTRPALLGKDDATVWVNMGPLNPTGAWHTRSVSLDGADWTLLTGTMSFEDVRADATLLFGMDVSVTTMPTLECGLDNITLLPEPASLVLFVCGTATVLLRRKHAR